MIKARGLARRFTHGGRTTDAVHGVDLDVDQAELVGFLGPNGAGKTTTLRMLTTLIRPTAGEAEVAGHDLRRDPIAVRRRIGSVAQGGGTLPDCRVDEEIELQGRLHGLSKADTARRAAMLSDQLDLGELGSRLTKTLSGGQRRRLDIALGLIHSPPLVFLDEPTAGLDPQSRANLWNHITDLRAEHGITVFLTTHYLDEADALCDRILVIDDGRIVAEGTPDELKARVSGDRVELHIGTSAATSLADAAALAAKFDGAHEVIVSGNAVRFRVPKGDVVLPELLRALDAHGLSLTAMQVHRPTLDDVFLTMTGRSLRNAESAADSGEALDVA